MILKNLTIYLPPLGGSEADTNYSYSLLKKTRHILNYIERECLRKNKYVMDGFNGIIINLRMINLGNPSITVSKSLQVPVHFDKLRYDNLKTADEFRKYVEVILKEGLQKLKNNYNIPASEILDTLKKLKENNYVNEWLFKKKIDTKRKIAVELYCSLTIEKFELKLIIEIENKKVFDSIVLKTDPDEVAFDHRFKDILINEDSILITSKTSKPLLEYSLKNHEITMLS